MGIGQPAASSPVCFMNYEVPGKEIRFWTGGINEWKRMSGRSLGTHYSLGRGKRTKYESKSRGPSSNK